MRLSRWLLIVVGLLFQTVNSQTPSEIIDQQNSLTLWRNEISKAANLPPEKAIPLLSTCLVKMTKPAIFQIEEKWEVYHAAQAALLAIPGHAEYFANGIKRERAAATSPEEVASRDGAISWANYDRVRSEAFKTLKHLPSVETVRVLGEFLGDEENPDELSPDDGTNDTIGPGPNSGLAIFALEPLIQNAPVKSEHEYIEYGEREAWQQWYEQIKTGHRTFRLKGDPTEYSLAGPASKEKLSLIERDQKRDDERATGQRKSSAVPVTVQAAVQSRKPSTVIAILAGCALIVGAIWYFLRSRRTA